jgi:ketosteroid isomerase-like protein
VTRGDLPGRPGDRAHHPAAAVAVVHAFERAVNAGHADQVVALATPDVEVGGPRGRGHGTELLREWVERAGIRLRTRRVFERGGVIVTEQVAHWGGADGDEGEPAEQHIVATEFVVRDGRIASVVRYDDLETALSAAGLRNADEVALR